MEQAWQFLYADACPERTNLTRGWVGLGWGGLGWGGVGWGGVGWGGVVWWCGVVCGVVWCGVWCVVLTNFPARILNEVN